MRIIVPLKILIVTFFLTGCTTTSVQKFGPDGKNLFQASNTSIGWDREDVHLDLIKGKEGDTMVQIGIGKSGGSDGLKQAIKKMEEALAIMKGVAK